MQIIKQIFVEAFYRRKMNKGFVIKDFLFLIYLLLGVCVLKNPLLAFVAFVISISSSEKRKSPEVISFVPMSQKEMQHFVLIKSNLIAVCSVIVLWISYGIAINNVTFGTINTGIFDSHEISLEFVIYHGVNIFGFIYLMVLMTETARMRGIKRNEVTHWESFSKYSLVFAAFIVVSCVLCFWLSIRFTYDFANDYVPIIERSIVILGLLLQYAAFHFLKKAVLQAFIYCDYNPKIMKNQEVDYEY